MPPDWTTSPIGPTSAWTRAGTAITAIANVSQSVAWRRSPYSRSVMDVDPRSGWAGLALADAAVWRPYRAAASWDLRAPCLPSDRHMMTRLAVLN